MDYEKFGIEHFINDAHFINWVLKPNDASDLYWKQWLEEHPEHAYVIQDARLFIKTLDFETITVPETKKAELLEKIHLEISQTDKKALKGLRFLPVANRSWLAGLAASFLIIAFVGVYIYVNQLPKVYQTSYGTTKEVKLEEGIRVVLNGNSKIKVLDKLDEEGNQVVKVLGEACFYTDNAEKGLLVKTKKAQIKMRGSSVCINEAAEEKTITIKKGEADIEFLSKQQVKAKVREQVFYRAGNKFSKRIVNTAVYESWAEGILTFDNTPLSHLFEMLENIYGYEIELMDKSLSERNITFTFEAREGSEVLLKAISVGFDIPIVHENKRLIIGK